jgi:UDP-N-acetylglucosamine 2-epimerase (non-hydrolysing)
MKIITGIGIRPDIIRLSEIIKHLDIYFRQVIVDTGQHYDYNLNRVMYEQLELREPNYRLDAKVDPHTHTKQMGKIASEFEDVLVKEQPELVVILGDNTSCLAMALAASKLNIRIAHIESGNRSYNWNMPEEKNRTIVDHLADLHFCYTEEHRFNLIREGINPRHIFVVGNPIIDVLYKNIGRSSTAIKEHKLKENQYILVTCHREENVSNHNLKLILDQLHKVHKTTGHRIICIEMPKLRENMDRQNQTYPEGVEPIPPQPYLEFLVLEKNAALVISDSGTVPEVMYAMGKPCIQIREKTERVELLENGATILVAPGDNIVHAVNCLLDTEQPDNPPVYKTDVAQKITRILLGNAISAWAR